MKIYSLLTGYKELYTGKISVLRMLVFVLIVAWEKQYKEEKRDFAYSFNPSLWREQNSRQLKQWGPKEEAIDLTVDKKQIRGMQRRARVNCSSRDRASVTFFLPWGSSSHSCQLPTMSLCCGFIRQWLLYWLRTWSKIYGVLLRHTQRYALF